MILELKEVVNWRDVVLHLGVPKKVADRIVQNYGGVHKQKKEAISWWLENCKTASWKELAGALLKADYRALGEQLMLKYAGIAVTLLQFLHAIDML